MLTSYVYMGLIYFSLCRFDFYFILPCCTYRLKRAKGADDSYLLFSKFGFLRIGLEFTF